MARHRSSSVGNSSKKKLGTLRRWILLVAVMGATALLVAYSGDLGFSAQDFQLQAAAPTVTNNSFPPQFMGLYLNAAVVIPGNVPWPTFSFGSFPLWGTRTTWPILNPSDGVYNWTNLDAWLAEASSEGMTDFIYSFGKTPTWASSDPNDQSCVNSASPPGSCDPPDDVNPDGTGTDQHWQDFVTAIVTHVNGQVKYWEMWNEANDKKQWTGTNAQLVRMCQDAYTIIKSLDPTALVSTPSPAGGLQLQGPNWMGPYLTAGGGAYADMLTFHGYISMLSYSPPENEVPIIVAYKRLLSTNKLTIPMWDTQAGWNLDSNVPDPDMQAAYLSRLYLLSAGNGVSRLYWFQYGPGNFGTIWTQTGGLNTAGIAYTQIYNWVVGTIDNAPCKANGTVYTCGFKGPNGLLEQAVWDTSQSCSGGVCTTSSFTPSTTYIDYWDLAGNETTISPPGSTIQIGAKPLLLKNQ